MKNLLFIDGSFFCFWRYNATKVWFSKHTNKGEEEDCHVDHPEFLNFYKNQFNSWVSKFQKQFGIHDTYWFADAPRKTLWRTPIFPEYKGQRDNLHNPEIGPIIGYTYKNLIDPDRLVAIPTAEADDCCAISAKYLHDQDPDCKIFILTGDNDYLQLHNDRIQIYNPKSKKFMKPQIKVGKIIYDNISPEIYLKAKCLMGDKSDNIEKVYNGCGPKTALDLAQNPDLLEKEVLSNENRKKVYQHNMLLISFDSIPENLQNEIIECFKSLPKKMITKTLNVKKTKTSTKTKTLPKTKTPTKPKLNFTKSEKLDLSRITFSTK